MDYVYAPTIVQVGFGVEPVYNVFESIDLLGTIDELSGMNPWIYETVAKLPENIKATTELMIKAGKWDLICRTPADILAGDFDTYLEWLNTQTSDTVRDMMTSWLREIPGDKSPASDEEVFTDVEAMMAQVAKWATHKMAHKGTNIDIESYYSIFPLLQDANQLKSQLIDNLHWLWVNVMREEWERKLPLLESSVVAYQQYDYQNMTALEAVRAVTGRDMTTAGWEWPFTELTFVPSPHIGPYLGRFDDQQRQSAHVMFGVRQPPNTRTSLPALSRSELTPRISALADDTRLRILELVAQEDEICAQDIMSLLDLTQSAASRNLRQLVATGYLVERRQETAKCYSINRDRIDDTMRALRRLLRGKGDSA